MQRNIDLAQIRTRFDEPLFVAGDTAVTVSSASWCSCWRRTRPRGCCAARCAASTDAGRWTLVWLADPRDENAVASEMRFAIDQAFRAEGIEIPFPQRDLRLRSSQVPG